MPEEAKNDNSKWISNLGSIVAITSALCVLISVLYEYGYYNLGAGISIQAIPTAMSDHIKACFVWLPIAIISITSLFLTIVILKAREKPENLNIRYDINTQFQERKVIRPKKVTALLIVGYTAITILLYLFKVPYFYVLSSMVWVAFSIIQYIAIMFSDSFIKKGKYSSFVYIVFMTFTFVILFFVSAGYTKARKEIESKQYPYEITLKEPSAQKIKANVLRSYDKVTFYVYSTQRLVFMQNDQIKMITKK